MYGGIVPPRTISRPAAALACGLALSLLAGSADGAKRPPVKAPKSGSQYSTKSGRVALYISGKSIQLAFIEFKCGQTTGKTNLNSIKLKKTSNGYGFTIKTHGNVTYSDDQPDENAAVKMSGKFSRDAKTVKGFYRVTSPRCGSSGDVHWTGRR
jgi:hypothetical protein